jgi:hypothetical protein
MHSVAQKISKRRSQFLAGLAEQEFEWPDLPVVLRMLRSRFGQLRFPILLHIGVVAPSCAGFWPAQDHLNLDMERILLEALEVQILFRDQAELELDRVH